MGKVGRPKKEKFADLSEEFKNAVTQEDVETINKRILAIVREQEELEQAKSEDADLAAKRTEYQEAGRGYKERFKELRLRQQFLLQTKEDRGQA